MALQLTPEEHERLQKHMRVADVISQRMKKYKMTGKNKTPKTYEIPANRRKVTKQITHDIIKEDDKWVRAVTRAQIDYHSGRLYLQNGVYVSQTVITFSCPLGIVGDDMLVRG